MKHNLKIISILVLIFFLAQLIGLGILTQYIDMKTTSETGETTLFKEAYDITGFAPPEVEKESLSFIWITIAVIIGTLLVLVIIKFRQKRLWKVWFFASVVLTLVMAFAPFLIKAINKFIPTLAANGLTITLIIAAIFAYFKVFRNNMYIHNFTELFIYGGMASLLVPILNLISGVGLLVIISIYDMYAVWHSKHMIGMAEFQTESKVFAGLMIPYSNRKKGEIGKAEEHDKAQQIPDAPKIKHMKTAAAKEIKSTEDKIRLPKNAILGGGDIAFPLLFSGAVMKYTGSFMIPLIISITAAIALFMLYRFGKNNRYYPAMPFISAGCFIGAGIGWLVSVVV
ncbi:MAG: presenilin family intramembrane aspartyl protease [Candidatus Woesearchaeota archaeon]